MSKQKKEKKYPDGRGKRPSDPNQLAKWIVEQSTKTPLTNEKGEISNNKPSQN